MYSLFCWYYSSDVIIFNHIWDQIFWFWQKWRSAHQPNKYHKVCDKNTNYLTPESECYTTMLCFLAMFIPFIFYPIFTIYPGLIYKQTYFMWKLDLNDVSNDIIECLKAEEADNAYKHMSYPPLLLSGIQLF